MEGILWKWTNYWNGWQTRWFILENGILSYYKSQDEVSQGCKGSVKVSACQINVNGGDASRLSIAIPGQNHMHLRAPSPHERQRWLVALGSAKACFDSNLPESKASIVNPNSLIHKKSELRLYCDLMMQQVHEIKALSQEETIDSQKLDEVTSLLGASCDTFIRTLEDCMKLTTPIAAPHDPTVVPSSKLNGVLNSKPVLNQASKSSKPLIVKSVSQDSNEAN